MKCGAKATSRPMRKTKADVAKNSTSCTSSLSMDQKSSLMLLWPCALTLLGPWHFHGMQKAPRRNESCHHTCQAFLLRASMMKLILRRRSAPMRIRRWRRHSMMKLIIRRRSAPMRIFHRKVENAVVPKFHGGTIGHSKSQSGQTSISFPGGKAAVFPAIGLA